jgi:enoyl-CoA hydratase/carnithine racemase
MPAKVTLDLDGALAVISLANPPLNLLDRELVEDFGAAVDGALSGPARAVLLRADGPYFSGGADVALFQGMSAADARTAFRAWIPFVQRLEDAPVPTVAAVHGLCLAGGLELALACDLIIAAEGTRLGQTEASIATTTLLGGAQRIAQRAGVARARSICYSAAMYDAARFVEWGIVDHTVPADELQAHALAFARDLANGPTRAHAAAKALIRISAANGVRAADAFLLDGVVDLFETADMRHGVDTLLAKGARTFREHTTYVGR